MNLHEIKSGFQLNAVRHIEDQQGDLYEFEHVKTGALLVWMKRADENKTFCIGFKTIPENDTGVFHICEHSVLNGSRKYPVREPFVDLLNGSMQTFLNAMTYPDKTIYPVSSRNPKDFLNLMDVYLDAVFHPAIYTNPNIFYQEGWHYEIHKEDEIPTYKGVVFNEMKGAFASVDELISNETARMLFGDNCYQYVSGGDPVHIPDLSYEQFKKAHSTFYHPSNARIFLDGDLDIDAALEEIDSYLRDYTKQEVSFDIPMQKETPYEEHTIGYEIGDEEDPAGKTVVSISTLLSDYSDVKEDIAWNILTSLLAGSNDAPLKKAILEKGLGQDVEVSLLDGIEQFVLTFLVRNTDADKKDEILDAVYGTLGNLAEYGLDHAQLQASLNHQEFMYRMKQEPYGVSLAAVSYNSWLYGGDPAMYLNAGYLYDELRKDVEEGYFEQLLKETIEKRVHAKVVIAEGEKDKGKRTAAEEAERLKAKFASWDRDEVERQIALNNTLDAWQKSEDTPEAKATLPHLKLSDVEKKPQPMEGVRSEIDGVPVRYDSSISGGIAYMNFYFSLAGIRRDQLAAVGFFAGTLSNLATKKHTLLELQREVKAKIGLLSFRCDAFAPDGRRDAALPVLGISCAVLKDKRDEAVDLILEILQETVFTKQTLRPLLEQGLELRRQMLINSGTSEAMLRAAGHFSAESAAREAFSGYDSALWISDLLKNYDEKIDDVIGLFETFQQVLFSGSRMYASYAPDYAEDSVRKMIGALGKEDFHRSVVHYPLFEDDCVGIVIPSQVSYSATSFALDDLSDEQKGALRVLSHIVSYGYLWTEIRVKGGAYGTGCGVRGNGMVSIYSFRDPTPLRSFEKVKAMFDSIDELGEDLCDSIIGAIASASPLLDDYSKLSAGDSLWFANVTDEKRAANRAAMLATTKQSLLALKPLLEEGVKHASNVIVGPKRALDDGRKELVL